MDLDKFGAMQPSRVRKGRLVGLGMREQDLAFAEQMQYMRMRIMQTCGIDPAWIAMKRQGRGSSGQAVQEKRDDEAQT